ncbi:MAG: DNA polymerase III subunit epsilon [Alphaproteobacteria bacterium]
MREIILDTETTGLSPRDGHRIVEIGCVEIMHYVPTGKTFHCYLNPERDMPSEAAAVHGLTEAFLADKPVFVSVIDDFLKFIGDDPLVIHNAAFDMGFLNAELERAGFLALPAKRAIDTVDMARRKFPGLRNSLDALCDRFNIDKSARQLHGALLDAQLLAEIYLELRGGRQPGLTMDAPATVRAGTEAALPVAERTIRPPRPHTPTEEELIAHAAMLEKIKNPLWTRQD